MSEPAPAVITEEEPNPQPRDKTLTEEEVVAQLDSGMTVGIGGWGSRRKPMSLVRAILRSDLDELTVVSYGGPDVGMLCAAGKVGRVVFAFVSLDSIPLEPHFRAARQNGTVECIEMDEGMMLLGLQAAAWRLPFLPARAGLGSDLVRINPGLRSVTSPYDDAEELIAVPALRLDAALVHLNRADRRGNASFLGPDLYFDDLMLEAASAGYLSCERLVATEELAAEVDVTRLRVNRLFVTGVVEAPGGSHPTSCDPDYGRDEEFQRAYAASAKTPEAWEAFRAEWLTLPDEAAYRARVAGR